MNMKKLILSLLVIAAFGMIACKKNEVVPAPQQTSELNSFFDDNLDDAKQNFSINTSIPNTFTGINGVVINIPANSFINSNGELITGIVDIELIEVLDVSDMVSLNKTTTSNADILVSGGQIKLTATQNSNQVLLLPNMAIEVSIPTTNVDQQMALFVGTENSNGDVNWASSIGDATQQDSIIIVSDTLGGGNGWSDYYSFDFNNDSLGWINCDYFWNNPAPITNVIAQLDTVYNMSNTVCYLAFPGINSLMGMSGNYSVNAGDFTANNVPSGSVVTFVCISEINGQYYSAFVNSTIVMNHIENITMSQTTLANIQTAISNL